MSSPGSECSSAFPFSPRSLCLRSTPLFLLSVTTMYAFALVSVAVLAGQGEYIIHKTRVTRDDTHLVVAAATAILPRNALAGLLGRQTTSFDPSDIPAQVRQDNIPSDLGFTHVQDIQCQSDCSTVVAALNVSSAILARTIPAC